MSKRRTHDSDAYYDGPDDNPIGLTSAFEVVRDPQAVEYDKGDQAIGLTEAFATVGEPEPRAWDEAGKWKDFDWDAGWNDDAAQSGGGQGGAGTASDQGRGSGDAGSTSAGQQPETATGAAYVGSPAAQTTGEIPFAISSNAPFNEQARSFDVQKDLAHANAASFSRLSSRGKHAPHGPEPTERMKKSHRTRTLLIVVIVLLIAALGALVFFGFRTFNRGQEQAANEAREQVEAPKQDVAQISGSDKTETATRRADVPNLTGFLGKTSDDAVKALGRGAFVSNNQKVTDKKSVIKTNLTVALAEEPSDSKTGTPNVYLGLDKNNKIIQVGYSASASALGFGELSFADAVTSEHVVEQTLRKIGVDVPDGAAKLPEDRSKYATYDKDKTTVTKERCAFDGEAEVDGTPCTWSAVLSYDYTTQVITGNLSDTVRVIYVYITKK